MIRSATPLFSVPDEPIWLDSFVRWSSMGVLERPGPHADHPLIVEMLQRVGLPGQHDETPWCSAAMNAAMDECGITGTGSARARSWENWGKHLAKPRFGCVTVLWRVSEHSAHGHVAVYVGEAAGGAQLLLWGGNQNDRVCIALYPRHRVLSYRWPDESCVGDFATGPTPTDNPRRPG